jgi:galactose mutarotase-like enzyme
MSRHVVAGTRIVETTVEGFAARTLVSPRGTLEATFVTGAGMVGSSLRHEGAELLDPRGGVARYAAQGATMGLPLLHPWANRLEGFRYAAAGRAVTLSTASGVLHLDGNGLPIHGLIPGRSRWEVTSAEATPSAARLETRMVFSPDPALLEAFPFPHEVHLDVTLRDDALLVATTLSATGDVAVPVSFGFHPYLCLPGVPREQWMIDLPVRQRLVLDQRQLPTGAREAVRIDPAPLAGRTFDDAFLAPPVGESFTATGGGRRVAVEFVRGYTAAQVFSPPHAAFICFEPMTGPANALVRGGPDLRLVAPGARFTAEFAIRVARA